MHTVAAQLSSEMIKNRKANFTTKNRNYGKEIVELRLMITFIHHKAVVPCQNKTIL